RAVPSAAKHAMNTYASETPVTDGKRVYVYHASAGLFAVDFDGKIAWSTNVTLPEGIDPEAASARARDRTAASLGMLIGFGAAASPALHDGRIFISADYEDKLWFLASFD